MKRFLFLTLVLFSAVSFGLNIVATINPYYLLVRDIVKGTDANVTLLVKPNMNPHTFSLTVTDARNLEKADLIIANGLELEPYVEKYEKKAAYLSKFIPEKYLIAEEHNDDDEHDEGHEHGEYNPHLWFSPKLVKQYIIPSIVKTLTNLDSKNKMTYEKNAKELTISLEMVEKEFDSLLKNYKSGVLIINHPSTVYLTAPYDIETLALEEGHGKEPSIKHIMEIIEKAKNRKVVGIFAEKNFNTKLLEPIEKELKKKSVILDTLGVSAKSTLEYYNNLLKAFQNAVK